MENNFRKCIYCNKEIADTIDEVPSRGLFPNPKIVQFIKIPACKNCNKGFSLDEEFFRNFVCGVGYEHSDNAKLLLSTKIKRSIIRRPKLAWSLLEKMFPINLYAENGVFIGLKTGICLNKQDGDRISSVLTKYIKGLFYYHFHKRLTDDHEVKIFHLKEKDILSLIKNIQINRVGKFSDVFSYGYAHAPNTQISIWLLMFFEKFPFLAFTIQKSINK